MDFTFSLQEISSAFLVLFAIIDITGAIPVFVDLHNRHGQFSAEKATLFSFLILLAFFFIGDWILSLFRIDVSSFAVAGSLVIFVVAAEMIFGVEIFKLDSPGSNITLVPVIFPLIAGPGAFTTLLSLKAEYASSNIIIGLILNLLIVYIALRNLRLLDRTLGAGGTYVLRKFFGIILLAIAVKLFMGNITHLLGN